MVTKITKRIMSAIICTLFVFGSLLSAAPVPAQSLADAEITIDLTNIPQPGTPVEFTATATGPNTIYYRFSYKAGYGTLPNGWDGPTDNPLIPWVVAQNWSTSNVANITFPNADNYIVVVQAKDDVTSAWEFGDPQGGMNIYVGNPSDLQLSSITTSSLSGIPTPGEPIMVEANSVGPVVVYYRFSYKAGYGNIAYYAPGGWVVAQDWSTSNVANIIFPNADNYIVVVQVKEDVTGTWEFGDPQGGMNIVVESP